MVIALARRSRALRRADPLAAIEDEDAAYEAQRLREERTRLAQQEQELASYEPEYEPEDIPEIGVPEVVRETPLARRPRESEPTPDIDLQAPRGSLRQRAIEQGAYEERRFPVAERLKKQAGDVGAAVGGVVPDFTLQKPVALRREEPTGEITRASKGLHVRPSEIGRFVGESLVPASESEYAIQALTLGFDIGAVGGVPKTIGAAAKGGTTLAKRSATALNVASRLPKPEPRVIRTAARPGAIEPYAEEGLAASRGAQRVVDPSGVRILGEGESLAAGERELFHGTARPMRGERFEPGTFLSPSRDEAASYADIDARLLRSTPRTPLQRTRQALTQGEAAMVTPESATGGLAEKLPGGKEPAGVRPSQYTQAERDALAREELSSQIRRPVEQPPPPVEPPTGGAGVPPSGPVEPPTGAAPQGQPEEFAANIRLSKYPEDIRGPIKEWADANPDAVQTARRSVRSDEQVLADAQQLADDLGGDFQKLQRRWKPGEAWNAEEIVAIRGALTDSTRGVMDAATAARAVDSTGNQLLLAEAILKQQRIQQTVHGVTAEAGRALRSFRQQADAARASGDVDRMQELLRQALGKHGTEDIGKLTEAIKALDLDSPVAVNNFLRSVNKPNFFDYMLEYWYNSVLSGPWTHARNIIGNSAATVTEPIRRAGAAGVENVLARAQGRPAQRFWEEAPASVIGGIHGIPEGVNGAIKTMLTGFNPQAIGRVELRRAAIPGPVGRVVRLPSTALEAMDAFFHSVNYRMSLWADVTRQARTEGLKGTALQDRIAHLLSEPTAPLIKQAADEAERLLFRGDPGAFARWLGQGKNTVPGLNFILPFVRTPANLLKFGVRNSPLGLLDVPMWKRVAAGNPQGADELAQTLMGSMTAAGFGALIANGTIDITAGVPQNSAERDRFYREGKVPFGVKIPGVGWVQYNQIPVLAETLTAVAATTEGVRNGDDVTDIATATAATIGQSLLDRSYLSGLSDFMEAVSEPLRNAERFGQRWVTGFVPFSSALRQTATAIDPTIRDPENLAEAVQAGIPGLSENVPARQTAFGEEAQRGLPSPIRVSPERENVVDAELGRLKVNVGFVGETIGGQELSRDEQRQYQTLAGQATKQVLEQRIQSEAYQSLSDAQKERALERVVSLVRDVTRDELRPDPGIASVRKPDQSIADFVQEKLTYQDDRVRLGYDIKETTAAKMFDGRTYNSLSYEERGQVEKKTKDAPTTADLDLANPAMDALNWKFSGEKPSALQSVQAAEQALAMNLPNRLVKIAGYLRPINESPAAKLAWEEGKRTLDAYPRGIDKVARGNAIERFGIEYDRLRPEQQQSLRTSAASALQRDYAELDAALAFWGKSPSVSLEGGRILAAMARKYGLDIRSDPILSKIRISE